MATLEGPDPVIWDPRFLSKSLLDVRAGVLSLVDEICSSSWSDQEELALCSYAHPNGFEKFVLARSGESGPRIRVHIWPGMFRDSRIHDHSWRFVSRVLQGELVVEDYEIFEEGAGYRLLEVPNLASSLQGNIPGVSERRYGVRVASRFRVQPGGSYGLDPGKFHRVESCELGAVTLVLQWPHLKTSSCILLPPDGDLPRPYPVRHFSVEYFLSGLRRLTQILTEK